MKKFILMFAVAAAMVACGGNEKKAEEAAKPAEGQEQCDQNCGDCQKEECTKTPCACPEATCPEGCDKENCTCATPVENAAEAQEVAEEVVATAVSEN